MIIWLAKCLKCAWVHYCHDTNFENRPCKEPLVASRKQGLAGCKVGKGMGEEGDPQ